jgi:hypothetical protein
VSRQPLEAPRAQSAAIAGDTSADAAYLLTLIEKQPTCLLRLGVDGRLLAGLDKIGGLRYHVVIAFHQSIPLDGIPAADAGTDPTPVAVDTLAAPKVVRNRW